MMRIRGLLVIAFIASLAGCGGGGGTDSPPGGSSTYFFYANYRYVEDVLGPNSSAWGQIDSYKDNAITTADALSMGGEAISTAIPINNNLTAKSAGTSISLSVTLGGTAFTGSAILPDTLSGVALTQNSVAVTPVSHHITLSASDVVVSWSTAALAHAAAFVTVAITNGATLKAAFSAGTITLPAGWAASGSEFRVYAANEAADLSPTTNLDTVHAYFRVSHATGLSDYFIVN